MSDYQTAFTTATTKALKELYKYRCAVCLAKLPKEGGAHCAPWFAEADELTAAIGNGLVDEGFVRASVANGMLLCPTCHLSYFTPNHIAFCPTIEVVEYLWQFCSDHPKDTRTIEEVLNTVRRARSPPQVAPFVDLFCLLPIRDHLDAGVILTTPQLPPLCRLQGGDFIDLPEGTNPSEDGVCRIFDAVSAPSLLTSNKSANIVFSSASPQFAERRLWRLHSPPGVIYAYLFQHMISPSDTAPKVLRRFLNLCYLWALRRDMDVTWVAKSDLRDDDSKEDGSHKRAKASAESHEEQPSPSSTPGESSNREGKPGEGGAVMESGKTGMENHDSGRDPAPGSADEEAESVESFGRLSFTSAPPPAPADYDPDNPPWLFGPQMTARDVMWILRGVPSW